MYFYGVVLNPIDFHYMDKSSMCSFINTYIAKYYYIVYQILHYYIYSIVFNRMKKVIEVIETTIFIFEWIIPLNKERIGLVLGPPHPNKAQF